MSEAIMNSVREWGAIVGGVCGPIALVWNIRKWWINRKRRGRQDALEIENLQKLRHKLQLDFTDKRNAIMSKIQAEERRISAKIANSGVRSSGRATQYLNEYREGIKREVAALTREHEAELRDIDQQIHAIENRPID